MPCESCERGESHTHADFNVPISPFPKIEERPPLAVLFISRPLTPEDIDYMEAMLLTFVCEWRKGWHLRARVKAILEQWAPATAETLEPPSSVSPGPTGPASPRCLGLSGLLPGEAVPGPLDIWSTEGPPGPTDTPSPSAPPAQE